MPRGLLQEGVASDADASCGPRLSLVGIDLASIRGYRRSCIRLLDHKGTLRVVRRLSSDVFQPSDPLLS